MIECTLVDDGTLDTVIDIHCVECGKDWIERFAELGSTYRDEKTGFVDVDAIAEDFEVYCECEPEIEERIRSIMDHREE